MSRTDRDTICLEDARVIEHRQYPGDQFVLALHAPECARTATPGCFVHIQCDADLPMRRPLSIMRADPDQGRIELLYKVVGHGMRMLSKLRPDDSASVIGPIGQGFNPNRSSPVNLLIGGGVGIPPLIFLAEQLCADSTTEWSPVAIMGSELPFPFELQPRVDGMPGVPNDADQTITSLTGLGVPNALASNADLPGCYRGFVTDLGRAWLDELDQVQLAKVEIFSCGPTPMLKAVAELAAEFGLPCQLCLEEFMACAVGGCAGCTVLIQTPAGPAMKRVCVDGPVFEAAAVYPQN